MAMLKVNINPKLLEWARKESGFAETQIAEAVSVHTDKYMHWEKNGTEIPFGKLKDLSKQLKRQVATFFLEEVPPKNKKPKDYRNLGREDSKLSPETLLAMRRANKYHTMAFELEGEDYWNHRYDWLKEVSKYKDNDSIIKWLRKKLKISIEDQFHFKSNSDAYKKWRSAIEENLGILTFQFSMPVKEVQGFCYSETLPYSIVANSKYSEAGRIFTLFHELAHILKHQSGICLPEHVSSNQQIELDCNLFAGMFLLPSNAIIITQDVDEILKFSRRFKISSEVYLRRMFEEKHLSQGEFFRLLEVIKSRVKPVKKGFAKSTPLQRSINQRGVTFFNSVMEGVNKNKITYSKASDALGLSIKYLIKE
jgi:Zn-dependent peptidase ImmA (M78 family)/transcriptional regulator with XRE-family HTH domain